jgi:serine/threonine protein kinase
MSKLLSQGGFGCVYHPGIKCDGTKDKKRFVSKLQTNNYASVNEVDIGKVVEKIHNYKLFFLPIIEYCKINITEIDSNLIEKCNTLHDNTDLVLMKMNYIKNIGFYDFIDQINKPLIISTIMNLYLSLLNSIELLANKNIVHYDLKDENILLDKKNKSPIIIDFGISLNMNNFTLENVEDFFYVYAPDYYIWSFDIHFICFLTSNIIEDTQVLTEEHIRTISYDCVKNNKIMTFFSDEFQENYKQQCIKFLSSFTNKTKGEILKKVIVKKNYDTWDNYAISCIILKTIHYIFGKGYISIDFFNKIIQILLVNIHPDPSRRYSIKQTKGKIKAVMENMNTSLEDIFTLVKHVNVDKGIIHVKITEDNKTIQDISRTNEDSNKMKLK